MRQQMRGWKGSLMTSSVAERRAWLGARSACALALQAAPGTRAARSPTARAPGALRAGHARGGQLLRRGGFVSNLAGSCTHARIVWQLCQHKEGHMCTY